MYVRGGACVRMYVRGGVCVCLDVYGFVRLCFVVYTAFLSFYAAIWRIKDYIKTLSATQCRRKW